MEKFIGYFDNKINTIHKVKDNDGVTITCQCGLEFPQRSFFCNTNNEKSNRNNEAKSAKV